MIPNPRQIFKTPAELDFYTLNYTDDDLCGDTINASAWTVSDPSLLITSPAPSYTTTSATVWMSAGAISQTPPFYITPYYLKNTAGTVGGLALVASIEVVIRPYNFLRDVAPLQLAQGALENFFIDWSTRLDGDVIVTSTWASSITGLTFTNRQIGTSGTNTAADIGGAATGQCYVVTNQIVTSSGRILENSFEVVSPANVVS